MLDKYIGMESRLVQAFFVSDIENDVHYRNYALSFSSSAMICFFLCHIFSSSHLRNSIGQFYFKGRRIPLHIAPAYQSLLYACIHMGYNKKTDAYNMKSTRGQM